MFAHWTITGMFYITALRFDLNIEGILTFFFTLNQISVACLATLASTQDYQDFQNVGRPSPLRINAGSNVDTKPTPVPILKQINK